LKWINNEEVLISNRAEEINFRFSVSNEKVELFLTPRVHDEEFLQNELILLNPNTPKEESL
jgi:hypothetical protein